MPTETPLVVETPGQILRRYRERAGLTQEAAAASISSVQTSISLVETGGRRVGMDLLRRMAIAYSLSEAEVCQLVMLVTAGAPDPAPAADETPTGPAA